MAIYTAPKSNQLTTKLKVPAGFVAPKNLVVSPPSVSMLTTPKINTTNIPGNISTWGTGAGGGTKQQQNVNTTPVHRFDPNTGKPLTSGQTVQIGNTGLTVTGGQSGSIYGTVPSGGGSGGGSSTGTFQNGTVKTATPPTMLNGQITDYGKSINYTADNIPYVDEQEVFLEKLRNEQLAQYNAPVKTQDELYNERLRMSQGEINSINAIYSDLLNKTRAEGTKEKEKALGSNRALQARSGMLGSDFGEAQTTNIIQAQDDYTSSKEAGLANEQSYKISQIMGIAQKDARADFEAKAEAKRKGAEALLDYYSMEKKNRTDKVGNLAKTMISKGIDINSLSEEELKSLARQYKVSEDELVSFFSDAASAQAKKDQEEIKSALANAKTLADISKIEKDTEMMDKMTPYQRASLAQTAARLAFDIEKESNSAGKDKENYNEKTIPSNVKSDLLYTLSLPENKKLTLNQVYNLFPEVSTEYLSKIYETRKN